MLLPNGGASSRALTTLLTEAGMAAQKEVDRGR
jgi:hypothetical protein